MNRMIMAKISHIFVAYMDVGEGREQDAEALRILAIGPLLPAIRALI